MKVNFDMQIDVCAGFPYISSRSTPKMFSSSLRDANVTYDIIEALITKLINYKNDDVLLSVCRRKGHKIIAVVLIIEAIASFSNYTLING